MAENEVPAGGQEPGGGGDAPGGGESSRDDVARAFDIVENRDAPPAPGPGPQAHPPVSAPAPGLGERARGPDGRFLEAPRAPKGAEAPPPAPTVKAAPILPVPPARPAAAPPKGLDPAAALAPAPQALRAPASWRPAAREQWAKLPSDVQQEVVRRESEVARAVKESANAREALGHVQSVLGPFAHNINASGGDPVAMMTSLFQADNALRHGSVSEKAQVIANIIKSYGVDLVTLDSTLAGQAPTSDPSTMLAERLRREMQQQLQPVMQYFGQQQAQRQRAMAEINTNASTEVESFAADEGHEFFGDVRELMADIMDLHTQRGATISLQDAYDRAIRIHPQVSEITAKRAESERASAAAQAAQRARRTAASFSSAPAPAGAVPGPAGDDRRALIEQAWDQSSGG